MFVRRLVFPVVAMVLLFPLPDARAGMSRKFDIPSGSMRPTLEPGDRILVSTDYYGVNPHRLPFVALPFGGYLGGQEPERGDVAVFILPRDGKTYYVARVIGLPGDKVQLVDGVVYLNGLPLLQIEEGLFEDGHSRGRLLRETLPSGRSYRIVDLITDGPGDNTPPYEVPTGHYFFPGDNRDNSTDSRFSGSVGFIPRNNLIGRAERIVWSKQGRVSADRKLHDD